MDDDKEVTIPFCGKDWKVKKIKNKNLGEGIEINFTKMYSPPTMSFENMMELSEYFGTKDIDFNNSVSRSGCETCDYGSEYGYEIEVYNITKNNPFDKEG